MNTHYGIITGPTTPDIEMICGGDHAHCDRGLTWWIFDHPLEPGQAAEVVQVVGTVARKAYEA